MISLIKSICGLIFCALIVFKTGEQWQPPPQVFNYTDLMTTKELCDPFDERKPFQEFIVQTIFNFRGYLGIYGYLTRSGWVSGQLSTWRTDNYFVGLRVTPWHSNCRNQGVLYSDTKVWYDVFDINQKSKQSFAFTTYNTDNKVFTGQKYPQIVYFVEDYNKTVAYQFTPKRIDELTDLRFNLITFDRKKDVKVVYDPSNELDRSGYFRLKYLYNFFPYPIKMKYILMFRRTNRIGMNLVNIWEANGYDQMKVWAKEPIQYAIVYTQEYSGERIHLRRWFLRSKEYEYRDYRETITRRRRKREFDESQWEKYWSKQGYFLSLDWEFDPNVNYCNELEGSRFPDGAAFTRFETVAQTNRNDKKSYFHFIEIYGTFHKQMKIVFPNQDKDTIFVESSEEMINNLEFINTCLYKKNVSCQIGDSQNSSDIDKPWLPRIEHSRQETNSSLIIIGIIATIVMIVVLFGLGVVLFIRK